LNDSLSYDITLALPLAYGVEGYALKTVLLSKQQKTGLKKKTSKCICFSYSWNNRVSAQVLSLLHQNNIKVRSAMKSSFR
jgi:hypothetical protein